MRFCIMMVNPNKRKTELHEKLLNWWVLDDKGNHTLKEGAPPEIVEMDKEYNRRFVH